MTDAVTNHKRAVEAANKATFKRYAVHGPYESGTKIHAYWLSVYDMHLQAGIIGMDVRDLDGMRMHKLACDSADAIFLGLGFFKHNKVGDLIIPNHHQQRWEIHYNAVIREEQAYGDVES